MGALSDLYGADVSKRSYYYAKKLFQEYGASLTADDLREHTAYDFDTRFLYMTDYYYDAFCARHVIRYFFLYDAVFDGCEDQIEKFKAIIERTNGLDYVERTSTDDDFFMFIPTVHSLGLELQNKAVYSPVQLSRIFKTVRIHNPEYASGYGPMVFRWV